MDIKNMSLQSRLDYAIEKIKPVAVNILFSGGYDSMIASHIAHGLDMHGIPLRTWAVDTQLSADGWRDYVNGVASAYGWDFNIFNNKLGFIRFLEQCIIMGLPRTKKGHKYTMNKLKGVAFQKIHAITKQRPKHLNLDPDKCHHVMPVETKKENYRNKTLFITGMRRDESPQRADIPMLQRFGDSNFYWLALIADYSEEDCVQYRINNDLPDNPFYNTVKGSGDCQCNWGRFITYEALKHFSPKLASGNVSIIDAINRYYHSTTWDGEKITGYGQLSFKDKVKQEPCEKTTPFLCQGCSRTKVKPTKKQIEKIYLQRSFTDD